MKTKLRGFHIKRNVMVTTTDEKGNTKQTLQSKWFACRRNAAIPDSHWMLY